MILPMKWRLIITHSHSIRLNGDQLACIYLAYLRSQDGDRTRMEGFRHSARQSVEFHSVVLRDGWRSFASSLCIFAVPFPRLILQPPRSSLRNSPEAKSRKFNLNTSILMIVRREKEGRIGCQGRCRRPIKVHFNSAIGNVILIANISLQFLFLSSMFNKFVSRIPRSIQVD